MARASTPTLLPLDTWARILQLDLFDFNQIGVGFPEGAVVGLTQACGNVFYQYGWQGQNRAENMSREEIGFAVHQAEEAVADQLGYYPAPKFLTQEQRIYPRANMPYAWGGGAWSFGWFFPNASPRSSSVQMKWTKIQGGGTLARTLIGDTVNLTLIDSTTGIAAVPPAFNDAFTCSIALGGATTDPYEVGVYIRASDRVPLNADVDESWRLRPVTVTITAGTATITGHIGLLVKPTLQAGVTPQPIDITDATAFVGQVTVYRVYRDSSDSGLALWEQITPCDGSSDLSPCDLLTEDICIGNRNGERGQVFISFTDDNCCLQWRAPDQVTVNYLAGEPLVNGQMNIDFAQMVTYLSCGYLPNKKCGCDAADILINYWRQDMTMPTAEGQIPRQLTPYELTCPFGYSRGALYAWNRLREKVHYVGTVVT